MIVEIGTEAALFPEKEYINGIFLAVSEASHNPKPYTKQERKFFELKALKKESWLL
jgi:hypothetical protein